MATIRSQGWIRRTNCSAGVLVGALMWSTATFAAPSLDRLDISLWPDYDRPAVLVIMRGRLSPSVPLPASVSLPMPATVGSPHAVAKRGNDGNLLTAQHTVVTDADWATVEITTELPEVRLEYYIDFDDRGPERKFVFTWPGGFDLKQVGFEVLQPPGATDFFLSAETEFQQSAVDGLIYHRMELDAQGLGDTFFVGVTYTKTNSNLTAQSPQPGFGTPPLSTVATAPTAQATSDPAAPEKSSSPGTQSSGLLLALVVILLAALVGSWAYFLGLRSKSSQETGSPE